MKSKNIRVKNAVTRLRIEIPDDVKNLSLGQFIVSYVFPYINSTDLHFIMRIKRAEVESSGSGGDIDLELFGRMYNARLFNNANISSVTTEGHILGLWSQYGKNGDNIDCSTIVRDCTLFSQPTGGHSLTFIVEFVW